MGHSHMVERSVFALSFICAAITLGQPDDNRTSGRDCSLEDKKKIDKGRVLGSDLEMGWRQIGSKEW